MIYFLSLAFLLSLIKFLAVVAAIFLLVKFFVPVINGAIYLPTSMDRVKKMLDLSELKIGQTLIDLGSGDGRILIEAAQRGAEAIGYEINPILVYLTKRKIKKLNLNNRAKIFWGNFWQVNLGQADLVTVFGAPSIMARLEKKFLKELKSGAKICSYVFTLPNLTAVKKEEGIFIYVKK
jgi:precorrin-6B methylase 2